MLLPSAVLIKLIPKRRPNTLHICIWNRKNRHFPCAFVKSLGEGADHWSLCAQLSVGCPAQQGGLTPPAARVVLMDSECSPLLQRLQPAAFSGGAVIVHYSKSVPLRSCGIKSCFSKLPLHVPPGREAGEMKRQPTQTTEGACYPEP